MRIDTKFDLGAVVHLIRQGRREEWVVCVFCNGEGMIAGANGDYGNCPKCYGRKGHTEYHETKWFIEERLTLGQVSVTIQTRNTDGEPSIYTNYGKRAGSRTENYMAYETGIGSGSIYYAPDLFATTEDAEAECERRNEASDE